MVLIKLLITKTHNFPISRYRLTLGHGNHMAFLILKGLILRKSFSKSKETSEYLDTKVMYKLSKQNSTTFTNRSD